MPVVSEKKRHGCLTAYLVLMIIANCATALFYVIGSEAVKRRLPNMPDWAFPVLIAIGIVNLVCAVALLRWKKWGFWGFCISTAIVFVLNLAIGLSVASAIGGLLGVAILYGVLHIGKDNKGWPQLD
jgi:hypothetical protein